MSPPHPEAPALAGSSRQEACLVPAASPRREPALWVPGLDLANLADRAAPDEFAGQHHHRVARVRVGGDERDLPETTSAWSVRASSRFVVRGCSQTTASPETHGGLGGAEMGVAGGDDRQVIDPIGLGQCRLPGDQALPIRVSSGEEQLAGGGQRFLGPLRSAPAVSSAELSMRIARRWGRPGS